MEHAASGWGRGLECEPQLETMELDEAAAPGFFPVGGNRSSTPTASPHAAAMEEPPASGWRRGVEGEPEWKAMELEAEAAAFFAAADGSSSQMEDMFYPAHEDEIQQLLRGPRDERDLGKCLAGESCLLTTKETVTIQTPPDPILNLLDFIPKYGSRCGRRRGRKRKPFSLKPLRFETTRIRRHSSGRRHHIRRNNEHWTPKEITKLVKGVSTHGVGSWTKLKKDFFSTSIRTAVHLKDKWRNLLKACGIKFTSKRKEKVQKTMMLPLDMELVEQIKHLARKHPYPRRKNY